MDSWIKCALPEIFEAESWKVHWQVPKKVPQVREDVFRDWIKNTRSMSQPPPKNDDEIQINREHHFGTDLRGQKGGWCSNWEEFRDYSSREVDWLKLITSNLRKYELWNLDAQRKITNQLMQRVLGRASFRCALRSYAALKGKEEITLFNIDFYHDFMSEISVFNLKKNQHQIKIYRKSLGRKTPTLLKESKLVFHLELPSLLCQQLKG